MYNARRPLKASFVENEIIICGLEYMGFVPLFWPCECLNNFEEFFRLCICTCASNEFYSFLLFYRENTIAQSERKAHTTYNCHSRSVYARKQNIQMLLLSALTLWGEFRKESVSLFIYALLFSLTWILTFTLLLMFLFFKFFLTLNNVQCAQTHDLEPVMCNMYTRAGRYIFDYFFMIFVFYVLFHEHLPKKQYLHR